MPMEDSDGGRLPTSWVAFLWIFAIGTMVLAIPVIVLGAIRLDYLSIYDPKTLDYASMIILILGTLGAGTLSILSTNFASRNTVKGFTIAQACLLLFNVLFLGLTVRANLGFPPVLCGALAIVSHIIYFTIYAPLVFVKNLQRPPSWCSCDCEVEY